MIRDLYKENTSINQTNRYNEASLDSTVDDCPIFELDLKDIMNDNKEFSGDYYNQMLARPDNYSKKSRQVPMSQLDRKVIEKSSDNIKRLLKRIDHNSEQFLK
jgi:hypothetical protein